MNFFAANKYAVYQGRRKEIKEYEQKALDLLATASIKRSELRVLAMQNGDELDVEQFMDNGNLGDTLRENKQ